MFRNKYCRRRLGCAFGGPLQGVFNPRRLRAWNPGPYAQKRVYDNVIQAYSGIADSQTNPATGEPQLIRQLVCDKLTALQGAQAVSAALFARASGRGGQHVELSMLDTAVAFLWPDAAADHTLLGDEIAHQPTIGSRYETMKMADGFGTATVLSDAEFQGICRAFGFEDIAADPRFATVGDRRAASRTRRPGSPAPTPTRSSAPRRCRSARC